METIEQIAPAAKPIQYFKTPTGETLHLKTVYEVKHSIKPFFAPKSRGSGGKLSHTADGRFIICPFHNGFTIVDNSGVVMSQIQEYEDTLLSLCAVEFDVSDTSGIERIQVFTGWQSSLLRHYTGGNKAALKIIKIHNCLVLSLDYAKGRNLLASTHSDHKLRLWEIRDGNYRHTGQDISLGSLSHCVQWHPHQEWYHLFTWGSFRELAVWRYTDEGKIQSLGRYIIVNTSVTLSMVYPR